jgi:hypothetical protein
MKISREISIKSINIKRIVALAFVDVLICLLFTSQHQLASASLAQIAVSRGLYAIVLPVMVLLVVNALPHDIKSMLVYWKPRGILPGCEAFTKYGPSDARIDMASLRKNVGAFPTNPMEQNAKWYKLYKMVSNEPEVFEAHKQFLMYRDMAVISLPLIGLIPAAVYGIGASAASSAIAGTAIIIQYLLVAFSARWSGVRFVCNVLAIHSSSKIKPTSPVTVGP